MFNPGPPLDLPPQNRKMSTQLKTSIATQRGFQTHISKPLHTYIRPNVRIKSTLGSLGISGEGDEEGNERDESNEDQAWDENDESHEEGHESGNQKGRGLHRASPRVDPYAIKQNSIN